MSTTRRPKTIQELAALATTHSYDPSRSLKTQLRAAEQLRRQGKEAEQGGDLETAFVSFSRASTIILDKIPQHDHYHKLSNPQKEALAGNGRDLLHKIGLLKPRINDAHEYWVSSGGQAAPARAEAGAEAAAAKREEDERQRQQKDQHHRRDAEETERASRRKQEEKERGMRAPDAARIATESIQTPRLAPEGTITIDIAGPVNTSGAFCDLFTGTHAIAGKVALKRPRGTSYTDALMKKIEIEAGLWIKLNHPRILKFLGLYTVDEVIYLVSPFAEFGSLPSYLAGSPGADRGCLVTEIAEGLAYLHQFEPAIVHGDVKGNNVLIGSDHHVRLCDFGLARHVDARTATDLKGAGSLPWQSPEILRDSVSKSLQSDVYAFGITIYEVLSGKEPYSDRRTIGSIITGVLLSGLRPPLEPSSAPDGTPYLRFWSEATRCWSDSPAERPSMADVLQSLKISTSPDSLKSSSQSSIPTLLRTEAVPELRTPFSFLTTPEASSGLESMPPDEPPETDHQQKHYGTESGDTDDSRADNWTLPRPAPPIRQLSRVHYSHLDDQGFALHSRGAPVNMIPKYQMQYDSKRGISLKVEHRLVSSGSGFRFTLIRPKTVWIGWNFVEIDKMDMDGTEYVNAMLKDMSDRPHRWMEVASTYTSETTVYRLVRKLGPEDVDYGLDGGV